MPNKTGRLAKYVLFVAHTCSNLDTQKTNNHFAMSLSGASNPSGTDYTGLQCESGYNDNAIGVSNATLLCDQNGDMIGAPNCTGMRCFSFENFFQKAC